MKHPGYRPHIMDRKAEEYLSVFGAVCIEGPKWCGKTWTSSCHCRSAVYIGDPQAIFRIEGWRSFLQRWCWRVSRPA